MLPFNQCPTLQEDGFCLLPGHFSPAEIDDLNGLLAPCLATTAKPSSRTTWKDWDIHAGVPLVDAGRIMDICRGGLEPIANKLFSNIHPFSWQGCQLTQTFAGDAAVERHIDGLHLEEQQGPNAYTALFVVHLSDVPSLDVGNFRVWQGSHKLAEQKLAAAGAGMSKVDAHRILSALSGQDADGETQLEGPRGSVVIMNYLTQHGTARHLGAAPRLALYFRIKTALTAPGADYDFRKLSNAWHEWQ